MTNHRLGPRGGSAFLAAIATVLLTLIVLAVCQRASAYSFETLYRFCSKSRCADGAYPNSGLLLAPNGNLYGTTFSGGHGNPRCHNVTGCGAVFELSPNGSHREWTERKIYEFCAEVNCPDGSEPVGDLVQDENGNLYGVTLFGGANCNTPTGCGVIFELSPDAKGKRWTESVLYNFCAAKDCVDGSGPGGGLTIDQDGNLYGTTGEGGAANVACPGGCGVAFEVSSNADRTKWVETVIYNFCSQQNCADGSAPRSKLLMDKRGHLFGSAVAGGSSGSGTIFELTPGDSGLWAETTLLNFCPRGDKFPECSPQFGIVQAIDKVGNLYGVQPRNFPSPPTCTSVGGCGAVFQLARGRTEWTFGVLHTFCSEAECADGGFPTAVTLGMDGDLYGTTEEGGSTDQGGEGCGTVFALASNQSEVEWSETVLAIFDCHHNVHGMEPRNGVIRDENGNLYGTTSRGKGGNKGTAFKLAP